MEVRKSAEKDEGALLEGLEAMRRAVIAEGCYPYRLVRVDMEARRGSWTVLVLRSPEKKRPTLFPSILSPKWEYSSPTGVNRVKAWFTHMASPTSLDR